MVTPRRALAVLLGLGLVLGVWAAVAAWRAKTHLEAARGDLVALRAHPPTGRDAVLRRVQADLGRARTASDLLRQPGPRLVAHLPFVGRSLDAERRVSDAAVAALRSVEVLEQASRDLGTAGRLDLGRVRVVEQILRSEADRIGPPLRRLRSAPDSWVPPPVRRGVDGAQAELLGLDAGLRRAADLLAALHGILGGTGERTLLVALGNNAELRGTGGLVTSIALGTARDGRLDLKPFRYIDPLTDPPDKARRVPAPREYVEHYGRFLANTTVWRNATMTPDGPTACAVMAELAAVSLGVRPDAVLLLDTPGMASIVSATGPVLVEGERITGDRLVRALLVDAYKGASRYGEQEARRRTLRAAADEAFDRVRSAPASPSLVRALADAATGRHLMLWSARAAEQRLLERAGATGSVGVTGEDVVLASTSNLGDSAGFGNKLDYYIRRRLAVEITVHRDHADVRQELTLTNTAPRGLGEYVEGLHNPGRLSAEAQLGTARDAMLASFRSEGRDVALRVLREGGSQRLSFAVHLPRGASQTWDLRYRVPLADGRYRLRLLPQPLASPAELDLVVRAAPGADLGAAEPNPVHDDEVRRAGPWDTASTLEVRAAERGWWGRFRTFLREPARV